MAIFLKCCFYISFINNFIFFNLILFIEFNYLNVYRFFEFIIYRNITVCVKYMFKKQKQNYHIAQQ
jgi:hypothetical protein